MPWCQEASGLLASGGSALREVRRKWVPSREWEDMGPSTASTVSSLQIHTRKIVGVTYELCYIHVGHRATFNKSSNPDFFCPDNTRQPFPCSYMVCHSSGLGKERSWLENLVCWLHSVTKFGRVFRTGGQICKDRCL